MAATNPMVGHLRVLRVDPTDHRRAISRCEFENCGVEISVEIKLLKKAHRKNCGRHGDRPRQLARAANGMARMIEGAEAGDWKIEKILISKCLYSMKCRCGRAQVMRRSAVNAIFDNQILQVCSHKPTATKPAILPIVDQQNTRPIGSSVSAELRGRKRKIRKHTGLRQADLKVGMRIGLLEVVDPKPDPKRRIKTLCHGSGHDAPKEHWVKVYSVLNGAANSCGCGRTAHIRITRKERGTSVVVPGSIHHNWRVMAWGYKKQYVWAICTACDTGIAYHVHSSSIARGKSRSCSCRAQEFQALTNLERHGSFRPSSNSSLVEQSLFDWVRTVCPDAMQQKRVGDSIYDICVPSRKLLIEMNGTYWHSEAGLFFRWKQKKGGQARPEDFYSTEFSSYARHYHLRKFQEAEAYGYGLVQIWDFQWLTREQQVKSFLGAKLGNCRSVGARELVFRAVESKFAAEFCEQFHIQGAPGQITLALGGFRGDDMQVVGTFGPHHRTGDATVVMNRYCVRAEVVVPGALAKISKMASGILRQPIKTWSDNTLSRGTGYYKAGWKLHSELEPDYFYVSDATHNIYSKSSQRKKGGEREAGLPERELRLKEGKFRVWDAGKKLFIFNPED
jgi:hypothetical protein